MNKRMRWSVCALLTAAVLAADTWLTYTLTLKSAARPASASTAALVEAQDPIDQFRLEREQLRARQEAQLNDIIYNGQTDPQRVADAQSRLLELLTRAEQELTLEGILQNRGFENALVTVSQSAANVLIRRETVTERETAVILELVMRETGLTGGNVKIIPVK